MKDDTISRAEALKELENLNIASFYELNEHSKEAYKEVKAMLKSLPPAQQWILCDKGEPDEDTECWVQVKTTNKIYRGCFTKRYGERHNKGVITSGVFVWWHTALAWMPIYEPEPYRSEGEG